MPYIGLDFVICEKRNFSAEKYIQYLLSHFFHFFILEMGKQDLEMFTYPHMSHSKQGLSSNLLPASPEFFLLPHSDILGQNSHAFM